MSSGEEGELVAVPPHQKATKVGGMRVGQDKHHHHHHHHDAGENKATARSIVANSLNAMPEMELTPTQREEEKQARLSESPQKSKMMYPQPTPTREQSHKQSATKPIIHQPTRGM